LIKLYNSVPSISFQFSNLPQCDAVTYSHLAATPPKGDRVSTTVSVTKFRMNQDTWFNPALTGYNHKTNNLTSI
jgi:hypothetical protein